MKVLFYIEPLTERDRPAWKAPWIGFVALMIESLHKEFPNFEFLCVVGDGLEKEAKKRFGDHLVACIHHTELIPKFGENALSAAISWYRGAPENALQVMGDLLKSRIHPFVPDICIGFSSTPFAKVAFENIPVLHFELGLYSRSPFPMTAYLDPLGMFCNSYFYKKKNNLINYRATAVETKLVEVIRELYISRISYENPLADLVKPLVSNFNSSILVVLQFSQFYAYDAHAQYQDQYDLLIQVLAGVPETTAVIAAEHPQYPIMSEETLGYLQSKYKNFIWLPEFRSLPSASQYLMEFVDCVVTVSSSVGLQSMLWKKPLIVLGHSHLDTVADAHDLSAFPGLINQPWPAYKDNVLAWHCSRYSIPFEFLFDKGVLGRQINKALALASKEDGQYDEYFDEPFSDVVDIISFYQRDAVSQKLSVQIDKATTELSRLESERDGLKFSHQKLLAELLGTIAVPESPILKAQLASAWYTAQNLDLADPGIDRYEHWFTYGREEGRLPSDDPLSLVHDLLVEREKELSAELALVRWRVGEEMETHLRQLVERERAFSAQIVQLNQESEVQKSALQLVAQQEFAALTLRHGEQEERLRSEIMRQEEKLRCVQQQALAQQVTQEARLAEVQLQAQLGMEAQLQKLAERERAFSTQIVQLSKEAEVQRGELNKASRHELDALMCQHDAALKQLRMDFSLYEDRLRSEQQEMLARYQVQEAELARVRSQARDEMAVQLQMQAAREQEFGAQILQLHKGAETRHMAFEQRCADFLGAQKEALNRLQGLEAELAAVYVSRSWRWTSVFRRIRRLFGG